MKPVEGTTVIGKTVVIRGQISGSEDLYLDGHVEGSITLRDSRLTVGPNAHLKAEIDVRDTVILGNIEGNVRASGRIEIRRTASVVGDLFATRLSVEENAAIQGRVELLSSTDANAIATVGTSRVASPASIAVEPPSLFEEHQS